MDHQLNSMERTIDEIRDALQRRVEPAPQKNVNTIKVEGAGTIWNGIAVGVALGAVIAGSAWVGSKIHEMDVRSQQSEAYAKAVYMLTPRFAEEIDKELRRDELADKKAKTK